MDPTINQFDKIYENLNGNMDSYEIILSTKEQKKYLGAHKIYKSGDNIDIVDDNTTNAMVHIEKKEGQEWMLIPVDNVKNIFEIEYASKDYDQHDWKLYVPILKENENQYRVVISKDYASKWTLIPTGDSFEIQEIKTEMNLTSHSETFIRDQWSNFAYVTPPGVSGDIWKFNLFSNRNVNKKKKKKKHS